MRAGRAPTACLFGLASLAALALAGCITNEPRQAPDGGPAIEPGVAAEIRWTEHGVPHVRADDWAGLGLGYGWAAAHDLLCVLAEEFVTVRGERALVFGETGTTRIESLGYEWTNLQSDLFYALHRQRPDLVKRAAHNATPEMEDLLDGFVAGYNRYLERTPPSDRPGACAEADWVQAITRADLDARITKLQLLASGLALGPMTVAASPPGAPGQTTTPTWTPRPGPARLGSNAYAFGGELTQDGTGILIGNPHFPWVGPERFHQLHLTIPGRFDAMGASLLGIPIPLIGFNHDVAWSHTVSTAWRFTAYQLDLDPVDPTVYMHDGQATPMEAVTVTVPVTTAAGTRAERSHTFWLSHYGPVIELDVGGIEGAQVGLTWDQDHAYTFRDANAENDRILHHFFEVNQANSTEGVFDVLQRHTAIPWVTTTAADRHGDILFADIGTVPHVPDGQLAECNTPIGQALLAAARLPVLDGSTSDCDWTIDADAVQPGTIPAKDMPRDVAADYVLNSNDSHWLPNAGRRLEGYSILIGDEGTERNGRTRLGLAQAQGLSPGIDLEEAQDFLLDHPLYYPALFRDDVVGAYCSGGPMTGSQGQLVDVSAACQAIAQSNLTAHPDDVGVAVFERFWALAPHTWTTPFDPAAPVDTPRALATGDPRVRQAFADAVAQLQQAGADVEAPNGAERGIERDGAWFPTPGADGGLGSISALRIAFDAQRGFLEPDFGNSYIQAVGFNDTGPRAWTILTYSQSPHAGSGHHYDQALEYSQSRLVAARFHFDDIEASPALRLHVIEAE